MPISQLTRCRGARVVFLASEHLTQQIRVHGIDIVVSPNRFHLMMTETRILPIEFRDPAIKRLFDFGRFLCTQFALCPIAITVFGSFQNIEQIGNRSVGNLWWLLQRQALRRDPPNAARVTVTPLIAKRILRVPLDRVVPVAHKHCAARTVSKINGDEAQVRRKNQIANVLFIVTKFVLVPFENLQPIRGLVAHFEELALHFFRERFEVDKLLAEYACSPPGLGCCCG